MALPALSSKTAAAPLPTRQLGQTDMDITPVGFGAWAIGGPDWAVGWGSQDDAKSVAAIRHAVGLGINWIDTAAVYGLGHSEEGDGAQDLLVHFGNICGLTRTERWPTTTHSTAAWRAPEADPMATAEWLAPRRP
jgi:diketogulonate reductase-like aldo/keto reductase